MSRAGSSGRYGVSMLKFAKTLAICAFALFSMNASAQEINSETEAPAAEPAAEAEAASEETASETAEPAEATEETAENAEPSAEKTAESAPAEDVDTQILTDALLDKQLREVSTNLDTLKEDTFTTKSRLLLLREEVLQRSVSGSRLLLRHKNDMGGQYELVQVYYAIDRAPVYSKQDPSGELDSLDDEVLYDHLVAPGAHQLNVLYVYRGKKWGVFRYMADYTFKVESGYDFIIEEGKAAEIVVTAAEQGGAFTPYEQRPTVTYDFQNYDLISAEGLDTADADAGK